MRLVFRKFPGSLAIACIMWGLFATASCAKAPSDTDTSAHADGPRTGEAYLWRSVAIGGGGFITGMSDDATGTTRVVRTDVHGAYIWNVSADRWVQLASAASVPAFDRTQNGMNQGVFEVAVAPGDPRRIYMAIMGRVYRSDDGGASWQLRSGKAPFPHPFNANSEFRLYGAFMAVSPVDPDLLFLGTAEDGLWKSRDGATSWTHVDTVPPGANLRPGSGIQSPPITVRFGPSPGHGQPPALYAASAGHGLYVASSDGAFRPVTPVGSGGPVTIAQTSFAADGSLFAIDQEAKKAWVLRAGKWTDLSGHGLPVAGFAGIAANPQGSQIVLTDMGGRAWCSVNGGAGWTAAYRNTSTGPGEPQYLNVNNGAFFASGQIAFDPVVRNRLWVAAGVGPYFADLGTGCSALNWKIRARGIEELVANDVIAPPGQAPLFAAWDFGIHRKPDLDRFSTTFGPKPRVLISAQQLDWSAADPAFIVTNASDARQCCAEDGDTILAGYSLDGGRNWNKFATLPTPPGTRANDPWRMSFGTIAVSANDTKNIVWAPAFNRSPFFTRDRGLSWTRVSLPGEKLPLTGSYEKLYGGRKTLAADRVDAATFYLVHSGGGANSALTGLWRTTDGGGSWQRVFEGEIAPHSREAAKLRAVPGVAGNLFFTSGVGFGPDTRLRRSVDGGGTWTALDTVDRVDDVAFGKAALRSRYPTIFISGRVGGVYAIWRSTDNADSWQQVGKFPMGRLDQVIVIEGDKNVFGRVYVGYMGSGWLYGGPARCVALPFRATNDRDCQAVGRAAITAEPSSRPQGR